MIRLRNLKAAWRLLNSRRYVLTTSNDKDYTPGIMFGGAFLGAATKLRDIGTISAARYDMVESILYDPSVIMLSKGANGLCYTSCDCQSDDDFNDLKECKIE